MPDTWESYFARVNGELASLFVNLGLRDSIPDSSRPHLVWVWVYMNNAKEDGLSSAGETPALLSLEEDLLSALRDRATFAGRITTAGRREFYFYGSEPCDCEHVISGALTRNPTYRFDVGNKTNDLWSQYLDVLYPSDEDLQRIKNRQTAEVLEQRGDLASRVRPVSHWAYFASTGARDAFVSEATARGFAFVGSSDDGQAPGRSFRVTLEKVHSVEQIDDVSIELFRLARSHGGEYDGWETTVEKEP